MPKKSKPLYRFVKVEEYFENHKSWEKLERVASHTFEGDKKALILNFYKVDGSLCSMLIQFIRKDIFRICFDPGKVQEDYSDRTSASIAFKTFDELNRTLEEQDPFWVHCEEEAGDRVILTVTHEEDARPVMKMAIAYDPFQIMAFNCEEDGQEFKVWETSVPGIYFTPNGNLDYAIIQSFNMPATSQYFGFGEQGGRSLNKDTTQITYFNFDNMRDRQVYNYGPLDEREPLYHSDPFFLEFNIVPQKDFVNGIFIDNPSQVCMDLGYINSGRNMFGTRFGSLDYYFFLADNAATIVKNFNLLIGRSWLKPRYVLGYHQGCYGYESRGDLEWVVNKYRESRIPLDGLHVDVDLQNQYQIFTINTNKYPDPKGMFSYLRSRGVKCSTNITPIISNRDPRYTSYSQGLANNYFVLDQRYDPDNSESRQYQNFDPPGNESYYQFTDPEGNFDSDKPYIGEVFYGYYAGEELGTTGHYADLARAEVREWWGKQYQYLFDMGLEFVWQDMTTPAIRSTRGDMRGFPFQLMVNDNFHHEENIQKNLAIRVWNLYSLNLHRATYEGLNKLPGRKNKRNFIIGRGSFAGMHRYAGLWTGDNSSRWEFLKINVTQALSQGMCGMAINGQDIGGFEAFTDTEHWADPELLIRWTAAGAFLPWFRNHYMRKGKKYFQEPFMYIEWFNQYRGGKVPEPKSMYYGVLPICKYFIELRYRLLQLFYDAMFENTLNGMPICRALFLNETQDKTLYNDKLKFLNNEFFVGKDLLVAPIVEKEDDSNGYGKRDVYLPLGSNWYCFMDNHQPLAALEEGGTTVRGFDAHIDPNAEYLNFILPIYVRAGAIIPTIELEQYVGELNSQGLPCPIVLNIYPGETGEYTMYLDDGESRSSAAKDDQFGGDPEAKNEYRQTRITHSYLSDKIREIKVDRIHDNYKPFEEYFFVAVLHDPAEIKGSSGPLTTVSINGAITHLITGNRVKQRGQDLQLSGNNAWYYNDNINVSVIKVFDLSASISIKVDYV